MAEYEELIKALRHCMTKEDGITICEPCPFYCTGIDCENVLHTDAAAAIEALEAENKTLHQHIEDLNGAFRIESEARQKAEAGQPHWVSVEEPPKGNGAFAACCVYDGKIYWFKAIYLDGKWLREMDGVELPVNYWMEIPQPPQEVQDGPIITPCRGCSDYDGYGGCKSKGGCARAKKEVQDG